MFKKLRRKFNSAIEMHVAGATVRHSGPFSSLQVLENKSPMSQEEINKYVSPFYMEKIGTEKYCDAYLSIKEDLDEQVVSILLGEFNWRPRAVGADFCSINGLTQFEENIGNLLLRSDVCYSGHNYCLALASFGSEKAIRYLERYLEYYLKQPDLWFDQGSALAALNYLECQKNINLTGAHMSHWEEFVSNKENWNLENNINRFTLEMEAISTMKRECS